MNLIRLGDPTDHGGNVTAASPTMTWDGKPIARKGDPIACPMHPDVRPNVIIEGDESMTDDGRPIARAGHRGPRGCRLISSVVAS